MQRLILWLKNRSKLWVVGAGLVGTSIVGLIDYLLGPQTQVPILYVLVVIFVVWFTDAARGVFIAVICTAVSFAGDLYSRIPASEILIAGWNSTMDFAVLLTVTFIVASMKKSAEKRRRAEETAQTIRTLLGAYVDTALDGIITINDQAIIDSFNPAAERIFGHSAGDVLGRDIRLLMAPRSGDDIGRFIRETLPTGQSKIIGVNREAIGQRKDGGLFPMELAIGEVQLESGWVFTISVRDVTQRRKLEKEVLDISDQERRRISQDLHDGLCQHLAATEFATQLLTDRLAQQSSPQATEARQIVDFIQRAMTQAREIAHGLHPVEIGPGGLMGALNEFSASVRSAYRIACVVKANGAANLVDDREATQIYRIVQEAVTNALKHGKPSRILIELCEEAEQIVLTVNDNGRGFSEQAGPNKGMGISIMKYRARMIGATLALRPDSNGGTAVILSLPRDLQARIRSES
jgi:two-component system, LuxR family, sensor kinase FixL